MNFKNSLLYNHPEVGAKDIVYRDYFSLYKTKEKRKNILLQVTDNPLIKEAILKNPEYFEAGLVYIFSQTINQRFKYVIPISSSLLRWKGYKKADYKTRFSLIKLYDTIRAESNLWLGMLLAYPNLDDLDVFD
jgi:hypothetical protein